MIDFGWKAVEDMTAMAAVAVTSKRIRVRFYPLLFRSAHRTYSYSRGRARKLSLNLTQHRRKSSSSSAAHFTPLKGHSNLKEVAIRFNPSTGKMSGSIIVDATSGESGMEPTARMHREILESGSTGNRLHATEAKGAFHPKGPSKLEVSGQFRLHGEDQRI